MAAKKKRATAPAYSDTCSRCGAGYTLGYNQGGAFYSDATEPWVSLFADGEHPRDPVARHFGDYMFQQKQPSLCLRCARAEFADAR